MVPLAVAPEPGIYICLQQCYAFHVACCDREAHVSQLVGDPLHGVTVSAARAEEFLRVPEGGWK